MKFLTQTIQNIINQGHTIAVGDDEGNIQKRTDDVQAIVSAINCVEECYLRVWKNGVNGKGHVGIGYIYIADDEVVDFTDEPEIELLVNLFDWEVM